MKSRRFIGLAVAALLCWGCFKSISYNTTYVLRPYLQSENQGTITSTPGVVAYAFSADTAAWMVASYADAVGGVLTSKRIASELITHPVAVSAPCPPSDTIPMSVDWISMQLNDPSLMIVAVDTIHRLYAYRQQGFPENLSPYYVAVTFRPWRSSYAEGGWRVVNEFFVDKPEEPENPDDPENPEDPENPGGPEQPDEPEQPAE